MFVNLTFFFKLNACSKGVVYSVLFRRPRRLLKIAI
jgi:hypothetical protein